VAWLIGNEKYELVRESQNSPQKSFLDLKQAPEDLRNMTEFFQEINFELVISTSNPDVDQMD